ncbi:MAG TPA: DUF1844 domain-containing protein [Pyrinomonadaceae bacterium]|nr:DUF1844 domain-containing protein [Pyrinomonadaceae bacterium]
MIGRDDKSEEVSFKVADRRKFNADGSVREGVVLEEAKPEPAAVAEVPRDPGPVDAKEVAGIAPAATDLDEELTPDEGGEEIPGADDPASFVNFLSTLATNAAASLGAVPHPATGKRSLDLETGKYWLDVLGMIREKTKGNLHTQEARLLDGLLADLRMQYVTVVRATEEKLKAQAAQKFSGADILGKK